METNKYILKFQEYSIGKDNLNIAIDREISQIKKVVDTPQKITLGIGYIAKILTNSVFESDFYPDNEFNSFFYNYVFDGKLDFNSLPDDKFKKTTKAKMQKAMEFAVYYLWLREKLKNLTETKTTKKSDFNLSQKILALHYLGLDLTMYDKTKSSKILSEIFTQSYSNTKEHLTNLNSAKNEGIIKTYDNLNFLLKLFNNKQFKNIQDKIKEDLKKFGVAD